MEKADAINKEIDRLIGQAQSRFEPNNPIRAAQIAETVNDLQKERTERLLAEADVCSGTIYKALKSAMEEDLPKRRLVESLGLKNISLDSNMPGLSQSEMDSILDELSKPLMEKLPEKF